MTLPAAPPAPITILAVEDDEVLAHIYEGILDRPGWRVVIARTLAEAFKALDEHQVSLVLLDLFLPDGDGRSWLAEFRSRAPYAATPVIVVAGSAFVDAQVDCYELGADAMLAKPVSAQVLVAAVTGALERVASRPTVVDAPPEPAGATPATRAVLLAEDDDVVAALVEHRLGREGFEVLRASDGLAALDIATARPLALAILDVMIPGLDGFELLGRLRQAAATAAMPIVMLTGLGGEHDVERALGLGADDYVVKPFSPVELVARVRRLLRTP